MIARRTAVSDFGGFVYFANRDLLHFLLLLLIHGVIFRSQSRHRRRDVPSGSATLLRRRHGQCFLGALAADVDDDNVAVTIGEFGC